VMPVRLFQDASPVQLGSYLRICRLGITGSAPEVEAQRSFHLG
jgi:hypothetical protein